MNRANEPRFRAMQAKATFTRKKVGAVGCGVSVMVAPACAWQMGCDCLSLPHDPPLSQHPCVNHTACVVSDHVLSFAGRDCCQRIARPRLLLFMAAMVAILTLVDRNVRPLGSFGALHWLCVVVTTHATGFACHQLVRRQRTDRLAPATAATVTTIISAAAITLLLLVLIAIFTGYRPTGDASARLLCTTFAVSILIAISVAYHYAVSGKWQETDLLRLSDAVMDLGQTPGLQVHRLHWIALDRVRCARRIRGRAIPTLMDDTDILVSHCHIMHIRKAGLLPA